MFLFQLPFFVPPINYRHCYEDEKLRNTGEYHFLKHCNNFFLTKDKQKVEHKTIFKTQEFTCTCEMELL